MYRLIIVIMLAQVSLNAWCAPPTLRIDYFHTGNADSEIYSLDQVVLEPLTFPGNLQQPIDATVRGKYLFEIVDPESGTVSWSRSFSSVYGEWETTSEAKQIYRTFHESLRFPNQEESFELVLKKRGAQNDFETVWRLEIDPNDYLVHRESAAYADEVIPIENNGDPETKVDILILGDGYTADEHDAFVKKAREMADRLFSVSPFRERRSDFNVWGIAPASKESGVSRPSTHVYRDTPFGLTYDAFRSERYMLTTDNKSMRRIASSAPYDFVEIMSNTETYGGGGIYGLYATVAANSEWVDYVFVHEFGHHFAGLADEYYTSSVAYETPPTLIEPYEPNVTALLNPADLKWRDLVSAETPLPTPWPKEAYDEHSMASQEVRAQMREDNVPEAAMNGLFRSDQEFTETLFADTPFRDVVGAFEGGNYQANGIYRPQQNCLMFTRTTFFCKVCANAIEAVIDEYTRPAAR